MRREWLSALVACTVLLVGVAFFPLQSKSHDWYPMECCHGIDCAPVEYTGHTQAVTSGGIPQLIVTTKHGSAVVPQNFPIRESKDHRMHACMRREASGHMRIICIFLPPSN
jgi:hypothetical protein